MEGGTGPRNCIHCTEPHIGNLPLVLSSGPHDSPWQWALCHPYLLRKEAEALRDKMTYLRPRSCRAHEGAKPRPRVSCLPLWNFPLPFTALLVDWCCWLNPIPLVLSSPTAKSSRWVFAVSGWECPPNSLGKEPPLLCQYVTTLRAQVVDLHPCNLG